MFAFLLFFLSLALLFFFARELVRLKKEKDLFASQIAHELKSPLTILRGYAEFLGHLEKLSPSQIREIGKKILLSSQRMDRIISAFLTLANVEKESTKTAVCDLSKCLEKCKNLLLEKHPKAFLTLPQKKEPVWICMKDSFLEIVLMNLLENAVRYSQDGKEIRISFEEKKEKLLLSIQDQGIGIPEKHLSHIFQSFYCAHPQMSKSLGGCGLGLFIVKNILDKTRGKIFVQSRENTGTTFSLLLLRKF